jgi:ArsR family transcriptional regulator
MSTRSPKLALFAQFAAVAKSLGHAHRLELLEQLAQGERSVEVLADRTGLSTANASQHLQHMRRAGMVANRREGKFVYYRLGCVGSLSETWRRSSAWCAAISMSETAWRR